MECLSSEPDKIDESVTESEGDNTMSSSQADVLNYEKHLDLFKETLIQQQDVEVIFKLDT